MVHGSFCEQANAAKAIASSQKLVCTTCNVKSHDMLDVCMLCYILMLCDYSLASDALSLLHGRLH